MSCPAFTESLIESELFGHVKGAFTGATADRAGYFELADGGTLFLDEVADLPAGTQAAFLRVLETRTFRRVGASGETSVRTRVIVATNAPLDELVAGLQEVAIGLEIGGEGQGISPMGIRESAVAPRGDAVVNVGHETGPLAQAIEADRAVIARCGRPHQIIDSAVGEVAVVPRHPQDLLTGLIIPGKDLIEICQHLIEEFSLGQRISGQQGVRVMKGFCAGAAPVYLSRSPYRVHGAARMGFRPERQTRNSLCRHRIAAS